MNTIECRKIAATLDKLAGYAIADLEAQLDVLNVPRELRWPVWENVARYAAAKAEECK